MHVRHSHQRSSTLSNTDSGIWINKNPHDVKLTSTDAYQSDPEAALESVLHKHYHSWPSRAILKVAAIVRKAASHLHRRRRSSSQSSTLTSSSIVLHPGAQLSVSKPYTYADLQRDTNPAKRPWREATWLSNLRRKIGGASYHAVGTSNWKSIPVFDDGDSISSLGDCTRQGEESSTLGHERYRNALVFQRLLTARAIANDEDTDPEERCKARAEANALLAEFKAYNADLKKRREDAELAEYFPELGYTQHRTG